jgi:sterol desaturase/sphingolipid hydroxylase (fatty acid hydroxylase superfamily)
VSSRAVIRLGLATALACAVLLRLERARPLRARRKPRSPRLITNATLAGLSGAVASKAVLSALLHAARFSRNRRIGILPRLGLSPVFDGALAFLLLDLGIYCWHRANHELTALWRLHRVHHVDAELDVSTALRFHPLELLASSVSRGLQVLLIGPSPALLARYEMCMQLATAFHHANLALPLWLERKLGQLLMVPRLHTVHHSSFRAERDTNYGVVFSFWDRLLRTSLRRSSPPAELGVAELSGAGRLGPLALLRLPFHGAVEAQT